MNCAGSGNRQVLPRKLKAAARGFVMADTPDPTDFMFPKLDDAQIARLAPFGRELQTKAGEVVVEQGDAHRGVFVVLNGGLELRQRFRRLGESRLRVLRRGEFNGEVNMLSGRRSMVRLRTPEAGTLFEIDRLHLRQIMQTDAELGEIFLNAFIQRRVYLIAHSLGDAVLVGSNHSGDTLRLREFLDTRNGHPHTFLDVDTDGVCQRHSRTVRLSALGDIPVLDRWPRGKASCAIPRIPKRRRVSDSMMEIELKGKCAIWW